jgi:hypothetical protein
MIRYTCDRALLPMVDSVLAANGYTMNLPLQRCSDGMTILVMQQGVAIVFLIDNPNKDQAEIEVYGAAQSVVAWLLETVRIPLARQPAPHMA